MRNELKVSDLHPLLDYLNKFHEGNLLSLSEWLNQAIYMFHYLSVDAFSELERQNCGHIIMGLRETIIKIHLNKSRFGLTSK